MGYIDLNAPDPSLIPGIDLWRVSGAERTQSKSSGTDMLKLKLERVSDVRQNVYTNVMLAGGGWKYGKRKLAALLGNGYKGELDPIDLIGRRVWCATKIETYKTSKGADGERMVLDEEMLRCAGMQPEDEAPDGHVAPPPDAPDVPF